MSKIAIVTDSTANLPAELVAKYNITVAPLQLIWGNQVFLDGIDIQPEQFYEKLVQSDITPTTSQATIATFSEIFHRLTSQGYDILTIVLSSKLSGTLDSAVQAKQELPNANIELVDSLSTSIPLSMLVLMAARAIEKGAGMAEVKELLARAIPRIKVFFAVDTLEYLHKGGRIGGAARFLGTALGLKPILELKDGKIDAVEKNRTTKKAHARLIELVENNLGEDKHMNFMCIIAADAPEAAEYLYKESQARFNPDEIVNGILSPVLGAHTGPGTVGVAFLTGL